MPSGANLDIRPYTGTEFQENTRCDGSDKTSEVWSPIIELHWIYPGAHQIGGRLTPEVGGQVNQNRR